MAHPVPQHIHGSQQQLAAALQKVGGPPVDLLKAPWSEVEKSVVKVLGGAFELPRPEHQAVALGLAGVFAERMAAEHQAFWFPNRDSMEGATLGFPEALVMLSPFGAVMDALGNAKLAKLDDLAADIRRSIGQVRFSAGPAQLGVAKLGPDDYQRLFDPGFLQFVVLEPTKLNATLDAKPDALARDIRDALGRTQPPLPPEARQQFEGQFLMTLQQLSPEKKLSEQIEKAPRMGEVLAHLCATAGGTGSAPEEFWQELILPLLFIGAPTTFPPVDTEEKEAFIQGAEPLALFVEMVPYSQPAPEEGLLGVVEMEELALPHPSFDKIGALRLVQINSASFKKLIEAFDPAKTREALKKFTAYLEAQAGKAPPHRPESSAMMDAAMTLLTDLKRSVVEGKGALALRRLTEAEAASEQALALVRKALQGPRIILT